MGKIGAGIAVFVMALAALPFGAHAADSTWTVQDFGADITIGADGTLSVVETIKVDFLAPHHGIYRYVVTQLPYDPSFDRRYQVTDAGVYKTTGAPWPYYTATPQGFFEYIIGSPTTFVTGVQTYVLKYQVAGALDALGSRDGLAWHVMGDQWQVGAAHLHAAVHLPAGAAGIEGACLQGTIASSSPCTATSAGSTVTFAADRALNPGEDIKITAEFPRGLVATPDPTLIRTPLGYFYPTPYNVAAALLVLVAGVGFILWVRSRTGANTGPTVVEFSPPDNLRPAQLGLILDEVPDPKDVTATIIDFASRGYLTIQDIGEGEDWTLYRRAGMEGLQPYEATIFQALFTGRDQVNISQLTGNFLGPLNAAEDALARDAMQRRWFAGDPRSVLGMWHAVGGAAIVGGAVLAFWLGSIAGFGLVGVALAVVGAAILLLARSLPRRTAVGVDFLQHTLGFRLYMLTAEKYRQQFAEHAEIFTELLPYAIVFGCCDVWAHAFAGLAEAPPQWYVGAQQTFDPVLFSRRMQYFHNRVGASMVYVPQAAPRSTGYSGFSILSFGGGGSHGGFGGGGGGGGGGAW